MLLLMFLSILVAKPVDDGTNQAPVDNSKAYTLIASSPSPGRECNPNALIKAVNGLHALGFEGSVYAMEEYYKRHGLVAPNDPKSTLGNHLDGSEREQLICAVLFEADMESRWYERWHHCKDEHCRLVLGPCGVAIEDGIPFMWSLPFGDRGPIRCLFP